MSSDTDQRRKQPYTAGEIARARELRRSGWGIQQISDRLGMGTATVSKFCKDVPKPPPPKQIKKSVRAYDQKERAQHRSDHAIPRYPEREESPSATYFPTRLPATADGFSLDGIFPDDRLVDWAGQIEQGFLADRAKGVIFDGVPVEVVKAQIVTSTRLRPWDDHWLRTNRGLWDPIRKFCVLNVKELAERAGISGSSFTRYANGTRTPATGDLNRIGMALWSAMQDRLHNLDLWLCLEDYVAAHNLGQEDPYDFEEALRWITGLGAGDEGWDDEITLNHLPSLRHVRSLMPFPLYREEDGVLFGYLGYSDLIAEDEAGAAARAAGSSPTATPQPRR